MDALLVAKGALEQNLIRALLVDHLPDALCPERGEKVGFGGRVGIVPLELKLLSELGAQGG